MTTMKFDRTLAIFIVLSSVFLGAAEAADLWWFTQPLDHFGSGGKLSNRTFQQRVYTDYQYREGRRNEDGMPILVYLGGESNMELFVGGGGIMSLVASKYRGLMVYIEYNGGFGQIHKICDVICRAKEESILKAIKDVLLLYTEDNSCNKVNGMHPSLPVSVLDPDSQQGWDWQVCRELVPHQGCVNSTMFETRPFSLSQFSQLCYERYGVYPHTDWISTYYHGGQDIKSTLRTSSSNIIFSNELMDPYSEASILEDVSMTIVAITTKEGSHCLDIGVLQKDDPEWLKDQRERELKIISQWIESGRASSSRLIGRPTFIFFIILLVVHTSDFVVISQRIILDIGIIG